MKTAVIISGDIKQIMLTPENVPEERVLDLFELGDDISVLCKKGTLYESEHKLRTSFSIDPCQGGYLRAFEDRNSLMLVLKPKKSEPTKTIDRGKIRLVQIVKLSIYAAKQIVIGTRYLIDEDGITLVSGGMAPMSLLPEEYTVLKTYEEVLETANVKL